MRIFANGGWKIKKVLMKSFLNFVFILLGSYLALTLIAELSTGTLVLGFLEMCLFATIVFVGSHIEKDIKNTEFRLHKKMVELDSKLSEISRELDQIDSKGEKRIEQLSRQLDWLRNR